MAIAIEPFLGMLFFALFTWGIIWRSHHVPADASIIVIAPVFAVGALSFTIYAIAVMVAPLRAFLQTYRPIYIVDGYVRYRAPDERAEIDASGYIAALFEDRTVACEWECFGSRHLPERTIPAHIEFSTYGGLHSIDGKPTGVLPDTELPVLAIGIAPRH